MCVHFVDEDSAAQQLSDLSAGIQRGPECGRKVAPLLISQPVAWETWVLPCESAPDREPA